MGRLEVVLVILGAVLAARAQIEQIAVDNNIQEPKVLRENIPQHYRKKLLLENFQLELPEINFELSSYLFMRKGALSGSDAYNLSNYGGFTPQCRAYKTDMRMRQYSEIAYAQKPENSLLIEYGELQAQREFATLYLSFENNEVGVYPLTVGEQYAFVPFFQLNFEDTNIKIQERLTFKVDVKVEEELHLINVNNTLYVVTNQKLIKYDPGTNTQAEIQGYDNKETVVNAEAIPGKFTPDSTRFYILTGKNIKIYEFKGDGSVEMVQKFDDLMGFNLLTSLFSDGYFYVTALNRLFLIDYNSGTAANVSSALVNGTCHQIEKFLTTLHLSCRFDKLAYVVEFFTLGSALTVNRYYASEDIQGAALVRRVGLGKMAILTDDDIRIMGYGLNRHALLETGTEQPQFIFNLRSGIDLQPIKTASKRRDMSMIIMTSDKLGLLRIRQTPAELYCEFTEDAIDSQYQVLLQFNTSRCSYIQEQQALLDGNIETLCEISVPVLIETKQVQLEAKHTNFIQIILAMFLLTSLVLIVACIVKYNKSLEARFARLKKALEKAQKGYSDKKAPI